MPRRWKCSASFATTTCWTTFAPWAHAWRTRLIERFGNHRHVGDIRGRGLFWALEFVTDRATKQVFDPKLKINERVKKEALARGLAIYPMGGTIDGKQGDHIIVAPPYIATAADIDTIVDRLGAAVDAALAL